MWSHFTAFAIPQPNWSHSGYVILYATACLYAGRLIYEGRMTPRLLFMIWGAEIFASCVFEVIGTGVGVYAYYGPYVMRIWNYPFIIGVLEGTQTIMYTMAAVFFWRNVTSKWALSELFVLFPMTFLGSNFGLGAPIIIALHLSESAFSETLVWISTFLSIGLCTLAVYGATRFLPKAEPGKSSAWSAARPPGSVAAAAA